MTRALKILHWNVNGIRAIISKTVYNGTLFENSVLSQSPDIIVLTETKISNDSRRSHSAVDNLFTTHPHQYHAHSTKKGYSGVSVYSRIPVTKLISIDNVDGRLVVLEYSTFILVATYVPNSGTRLDRLDYRTTIWDREFRSTCKRLSRRKPLIIIGDLNVAHMDLDISHPERHRGCAGFTDAERGNFDSLLRSCDLLDTWRMLHESIVGYTYFDYRTKARQRNAGWRLDYVLISSSLQRHLRTAEILRAWEGSDHVPITCTVDV
jgi:exodeoxyribonuclease-3